MKIARINVDGLPRLALVVDSSRGLEILDLQLASHRLALSEKAPLGSMREFIASGSAGRDAAFEIREQAQSHGLELMRFEEVLWLPPVDGPVSVVCAGRNFGKHLREGQKLWAKEGVQIKAPAFPTGFAKLPGALVGHLASVRVPLAVTQLDYEIEVAAVMGPERPGGNEPLERVFGYTIFNDLADREMQLAEMRNQLLISAKNYPGFGPMGPWITTSDEAGDPSALAMELKVNGDVRQQASTSDMLFSFRELVDFWSRLPLGPGDVIASGTPDGPAIGRPDPAAFFLKAGDRVDAGVAGLGTLTTFFI